MSKKLRKYGLLLLAIILTIGSVVNYYSISHTDHEAYINTFQTDFNNQVSRLEKSLAFKAKEIKHQSVNDQWLESKDIEQFSYHVFRNDSLLFWNTNQLPIIRFANIHFPSEGLIHLQNGWYWTKTVEAGKFKIAGTFLIKQDFAYENKDLNNEFIEPFNIPFNADIAITAEDGYSVYNSNGDYVLSIVPFGDKVISERNGVVFCLLILAAFICWLLIAYRLQRKWNSKSILLPLTISIGYLLSLQLEWWSVFEGVQGFDPKLFGVNRFFPNFIIYQLNIALIIYIIYSVIQWLLNIKKVLVIGIFAVLSFLIWPLLIFLLHSLVEDSSIPLDVEHVFTLNVYSLLSMASIGALFYSQFHLILGLVKQLIVEEVRPTLVAVSLFILSMSYFLYEINSGFGILSAAVLPLVVSIIAFISAFRDEKKNNIGVGLLMLFFFAATVSNSLSSCNTIKERGEREIYANQLAIEKDIETEIQYDDIATKIKNDNFIQKLVKAPFKVRLSDFQENLERRIFNGFWERYELSFNLYNDTGTSLVDFSNAVGQSMKNLDDILKASGEKSQINESVYFINDYKEQFSYIIKQPIIAENGNHAFLFITLKSKKIPEEIGFPRLLISSDANVLETLEEYSISKYYKNTLLTKYGEFNYPSICSIMFGEAEPKTGYINYGGYNHYVFFKSKNDAVVLSKKNLTILDYITTFSYLFSFYGLLLLPLIFRGTNDRSRRTFTLAMKIQLVLVSLVFISLFTFGWGSGIFVRNQYNEFTNDVIREKLNSVQTEVKSKLGQFQELSISENGDYMEYILKKFSKVFFTDINLYDRDGYLLASSRSKVFNVGLLSEQMNPEAFKNLKYSRRSEYVHLENIGALEYSSAYQPFYNESGEMLAFINLQHFGQQNEFENQIQKFLVAIINVFILLLAISIILAILISNWLTSPLRILQENFAAVRFGEKNEPISYEKEDEIGNLVKEYNKKIEELEFTAEQLAKSERESAWREMAKQVAHEIKNPLTPMKLSVQQLLRTYDPEDPNSRMKLERVAKSIVEQIDALTKIANEFSNFAKMPTLSMHETELISLLKNVVEVFSNREDVLIEFSSEMEIAPVLADHDQLIRVFNNLIKNAIQALSKDREGKISILVSNSNEKVIVQIQDNGMGIPEDVQSKIFVPYFTTKSTGTGLGLAMVKQIIENHQGSIDYTTELNVGTSFIIELPIIQKG